MWTHGKVPESPADVNNGIKYLHYSCSYSYRFQRVSHRGGVTDIHPKETEAENKSVTRIEQYMKFCQILRSGVSINTIP